MTTDQRIENELIVKRKEKKIITSAVLRSLYGGVLFGRLAVFQTQ